MEVVVVVVDNDTLLLVDGGKAMYRVAGVEGLEIIIMDTAMKLAGANLPLKVVHRPGRG